MRVYEALAKEFRRQGIDRVFGLMGEDLMKLVVELDRCGIPYVAVRHENQAVAMADGYARLSGRVGVALTTSGPGFTNALSLINTANRAHSRVLVLVGARIAREDELGSEMVRRGKNSPVLAICAAEGIHAVKPKDPTTALSEARAAITHAKAGNTVVLNLAVDLIESASTEETDDTDAAAIPQRSRLAPDPGQIALVADLLQETWAFSRPLILAGRGAVSAGAGPALERLGELVGAAMATSLLARPYFKDDPYCVGVSGTFTTSLGSEVITSSDLVFVFGASLNFFQTFGNSLFSKARMVRVDTNQDVLDSTAEVAEGVHIQADARLAAEALVAELERREHRATGVRTAELAERIAAFDPAADFRDESLPDRIDPRTAMLNLDRILPRERIVVVDPSHQLSFTAGYLQVPRPEFFALPIEAGSIGVTLGEAIGAAFAHPGVVSVAALGDAGLMMALAEIDTAVRYNLPVVVVVCNDMALGAEVHLMNVSGVPSALAKVRTPSLAAVAQAMGAEGYTVKSIGDFAALEQRFAQPLDGPIVIDCLVNGEVRAEWVEAQSRNLIPPPIVPVEGELVAR